MSTLLPCLAAALLGSPQAPITVPFRIADSAIIVDAKVNGAPVSLLFDTGFGGSVLLSSSIEVGPPAGHMVLRDFVGELEATTVKLKTMQLGSQSLSPSEKTIVQQPANFTAAYGQHVDGILGLDAVKGMVMEINFEKNEFIFYPSSVDVSSRTPDNKKTFLTSMLPIGSNSIELPVLTDTGQKMTLALDTGNAFYATTHRDVLERVGLWQTDRKPKFIKYSGVASGAVDSWEKKMPPLKIFGIPVQSTVWDIIDLPSSTAEGDGTVGFGFLSNFNITFDYQRRRVWFENWKTPVENQEPGDIGLSAHFDGQLKRTVVFNVSPDSPAEQAGVKEDDEILSIDSLDLSHPTSKELRRMFSGPVGSQVKLTVSRGGVLKRFDIKRGALYND